LKRQENISLASFNFLVLTGDFDGLVLHMAIPDRSLVGEDTDAWYVRAEAER
jgi:UDP-N-acetylmuramate dehydrogenase